MKSLFKKILIALPLSAMIYILGMNTAIATEEIDVLFLYEPAVSDHYNGEPSTRINHIVETTNAIFESSQLDIKINATEIQQYHFDDEMTARELMASAKNSTPIEELRNSLGADLVVIYRLYRKGQPCGLAYRPAEKNGEWLGLSYVAINCAVYKTAHEIGHNMGLAHSYEQGSVAFLPYARGHGVRGKFATIMAYGSAYDAPKVYKFSSPEHDCNGLPCGIKKGEQQADAVRALKETASIVANLRKPNKPQCNTEDLAIFNKIQDSYDSQKATLSNISLKLKNQQNITDTAQADYQNVMLDYVQLITESFQPANTQFQSAKSAYLLKLAAYKKGQIDRDTAVISYNEYKTARNTLINEQNKIKDFHANQYLPSYKNMQSTQLALNTLKANYETEAKKSAQLETEYVEAQTIYQCA